MKLFIAVTILTFSLFSYAQVISTEGQLCGGAGTIQNPPKQCAPGLKCDQFDSGFPGTCIKDFATLNQNCGGAGTIQHPPKQCAPGLTCDQFDSGFPGTCIQK